MEERGALFHNSHQLYTLVAAVMEHSYLVNRVHVLCVCLMSCLLPFTERQSANSLPTGVN